jgi:hypothetical protein
MPKTPLPVAEEILTQLVTGPSISEVAAAALRPELDRLYPQLQIDPTRASVVTPTWVITDDRVVPGINRYESLTAALVRTGLAGTTLTYIDGEHFLTLHPGDEPAVQLPVKIDALGCLINELAPLLFIAYQQQQLDYWNQTTRADAPRWHQLSASLHNLWNVDTVAGWDDEQMAMASAFYKDPDRASRRLNDKYLSKACLIDIDGLQGQAYEHLHVLDVAVLVGTSGTRTMVLSHSLAEGFKQHDSLEALGDTLLKRIERSTADPTLQWRLYEPAGNFFRHQACALIALEVEAIGGLANTGAAPPGLAPQVGAATNSFADYQAMPSSHFSKVQDLLPDWLKHAPPADLTRYSRHLMDLAQLREQDAGKSFLEGIPSLVDFTQQTLRKQIIKDHPTAASLKLENIQISVTSVIVLGAVTVPGKTQTLTLSLVELALQNLVALPVGNKTVQDKSAAPVPAWLTPAYLETLVTQVDIGQAYPALIKRQLMADPVQTQGRQALYTRHLRIQLPLQALQHKIRGEAGIDERGYRYIVAALQAKPAERFVDEQRIDIRPLAFITGDRSDSEAEEVANMFVIGPRHADQGPCLLYRPLLDPPLTQYPGEANLLYAIRQDRLLRQSVLAWMPEAVRFNYSQYVFPGPVPSVWTVAQLLVDPASVFASMGRVSLAAKPLDEDPLTALFNSNANAMITLADRQTVSNAEARWETLKQGAWMLFNIALPFLGRTAGAAAWIGQILDDLQEVADGQDNRDEQQLATAVTDLLLTLGMVLAHQAAARHAPRMRLPAKAVTRPVKPEPTTRSKVARLPDVSVTPLPSSHEISVHAIAALPASDLGLLLDGLAIDEPKGLTLPSHDNSAHQHLSALGDKWYAKVAHRWFEVRLTDNADVQIIDSRQSAVRTGPLLISNAKGQWFIDTRLRLKGGGKRQLQQKANKLYKARLMEQNSAFEAQKPIFEAQLAAAEAALASATLDSAPQRQHLLETIDAQTAAIDTNIEILKTYNALETIPNFRDAVISRLRMQLGLTEQWFSQQKAIFDEQMRLSLLLFDDEPLQDPRTPRQIHQNTSDLTEAYIGKIEFAHSRFAELHLLGKEAAEVTRHYKATLPPFSLQDLKILQVSMAQELCLNDSATVATEDAGAALHKVVESAGLTIQSSLDLAGDGDVLHLADRIDGLSDLVEQFATLDERIIGLPGEYPGQWLQPALDLMRQRIAAFGQDAVMHLATLLRERRTLEPQPGPSRAAAPVKRIIKTRYRGTVVGQLRGSAAGEDAGLLDVTSPLTGKVLATFHEKSPGVWLERTTANANTEVKPKADLNKSIKTGRTLLAGVAAFRQRLEADIKRAPRIPKEIEEIYYQYAARLHSVMKEIDDEPTTSNSTQDQPEDRNPVSLQLDQSAQALFAEGRRQRIAMTKQQPPTAARIEWLKSKGEVEISRPDTSQRRRLKGPRKDYLLEYEVLDTRTRQVLWYAHFHYSTLDAPVQDFSVAHLKTADQRNLGGQYDVRGSRSDAQAIAIYRSEISRPLASALFLS